jgi:hypothetical protein
MADIEVVVASALSIFPQDLALSSKSVDVAETAVFQTTVDKVYSRQSYDRNPSLALLFCAPGFQPDRNAIKTHDMLISPTASGNVVQILYSILTCDIDVNTRVGTVSWRMSIQRFESMKQDGWVLYFWQTDEPFVCESPST